MADPTAEPASVSVLAHLNPPVVFLPGMLPAAADDADGSPLPDHDTDGPPPTLS